MYAFINIGSNLGNRRLNLSRAVAEIEKVVGFFELSHTLETHPWGYVSPNAFLNVGMSFQTDLSPEELLDALQEVEGKLCSSPHRKADGGYADREVDIDIVALDELIIDTPRLKVPHPMLPERVFFLQPMAELAPGWRHPATSLTAAEMLSRLEMKEGEAKSENPV